jgi:hypothetical protein
MKLKEFRAEYPQYNDLNDIELANVLHRKFYSDVPIVKFYRQIGAQAPKEYDASEGMSGGELFIAGAQKMGKGLWRGLKALEVQAKPYIPADIKAKSDAFYRQQEDAINARDADLMRNWEAKGGAITGAATLGAPLAAVPGANTLLGASVIGALTGAAQPVGTKDSRAKNAIVGGIAAPATMAAGRGLAAGYRGLKSMVEPLTRGGQERIAARALESFAGGPQAADDAAAAIANAGPELPGYQPTTAELAGNAGLSQLERQIANNPEYLTALTQRAQDNRGAILSAVNSVAGDDAAMKAAVQARQTAGNQLYPAAKAAVVPADEGLTKLLARPSMAAAWTKAQQLAAEFGEQLPEVADAANIDGRSLHYLKMAMDDLADNPAANGFAGNQARAIKDTRAAFVKWVESKIPEYRVARETYADLSKPINQMEIGKVLRDKLQPALADFGASTRMRPQSFAQAMRDGDTVAANVLNRSNASIADIMTPDQMATLNKVGQTLGRQAKASELGKAVGSNTAQNLISQNVMRQILGPLGLPQSTMERAAQSTLLQSALRPVQWAGRLGEAKVMDKLAEAALDPKVAEALLKAGVPANKIGLLQYQALLNAPAAVSGANSMK